MEIVYLNKTCTKITPKSDNSIAVDIDLAGVLLLLNRQGYKTIASRSNSFNRGMYISFIYSKATVKLCKHVFENLSKNDKNNRVTISMYTHNKHNVKTISINQEATPCARELIDKLIKVITVYLIHNNSWLKHRIELGIDLIQDYPYNEDFLKYLDPPTKTE